MIHYRKKYENEFFYATDLEKADVSLAKPVCGATVSLNGWTPDKQKVTCPECKKIMDFV